jgi:hypothetical protein
MTGKQRYLGWEPMEVGVGKGGGGRISNHCDDVGQEAGFYDGEIKWMRSSLVCG